MKTLKDVLFDGKDSFISLNKLTGKTVSDIEIILSTEFGYPSIQLFRIHFSDATSTFVEGEHDHPYLDSLCGVHEEEIAGIRREANGG